MKSATNTLCGPVVDLVRRASLHHDAVAHHDDPVGERERLGLVMRDVDAGQSEACVDALDLGTHLDTQLGVEIRERLVEQKQPRVQHQRAGDRDALLLPAGELRWIAILEFRQAARAAASRARVRLIFGRRPALQLEPECDIAEHRHVREQRIVLEHHAETALLGRHVVHALAVDPQLAFARRNQAGHDVERGGFPAAARAEQGDELTALHFEGEVVKDRLAPKRLVIRKRSDSRF